MYGFLVLRTSGDFKGLDTGFLRFVFFFLKFFVFLILLCLAFLRCFSLGVPWVFSRVFLFFFGGGGF